MKSILLTCPEKPLPSLTGYLISKPKAAAAMRWTSGTFPCFQRWPCTRLGHFNATTTSFPPNGLKRFYVPRFRVPQHAIQLSMSNTFLGKPTHCQLRPRLTSATKRVSTSALGPSASLTGSAIRMVAATTLTRTATRLSTARVAHSRSTPSRLSLL